MTLHGGWKAVACLFQVAVLSYGSGPMVRAQTAPWKTGREFQQARTKIISVGWQKAPTRDALMNLARQQQVAIFLDRRIDPTQAIEFRLADHSLNDIIFELAEQIGAGACLLGDCYYVGPKATVARLVHFRKQANEQLKLATPDDRRKWQARNAAAWEDATRVETIIQRIAQERDLELHNADRLPFDIWPAYDLPPLSATDQIALVLAGFDCTWTFDPASNQIAIQPMRRDEAITAAYRGGRAAAAVDRLKQEYPGVIATQDAGVWTVTARPEAHYRLTRILAASRPERTPSRDAKKLVTLNTSASIGAILKEIARRLEVELSYSDDLVKAMRQPVTVQVDKVPYKELIEQTLRDSGLIFELTGDKLIIRRK